MKKKIKKSLLFLIVAFGLISCAGLKVSCPAFEEEILSWMPYQANDVIELYSQSNDSTIIFSIKSVEITHTTHYTTGMDCGGCDDYILIRDYDDSNFQVAIRLEKNKVNYQRYCIGDSNFYSYSESTNFLFENKKYDIVRIFDNNSNETFNKLIVAKGIGIIGLVDIDGNIWSLKTTVNNGQNELRNAVINNVVSC